MHPAYWDEAKRYLSQADGVMAEVIASYPGEVLTHRGCAFATLCRSIIGQQISVKAADAITTRVEALVEPYEPMAMLNVNEEALRACGLSRQKVTYLRSIAETILEKPLDQGYFEGKTDAEVEKELVQIKGVGRWTAEMYMIFYLQRPDVWPVADIGLQKAIKLHYEREDYHGLGERFAPWRTVACWYLWRSLDPVPVSY